MSAHPAGPLPATTMEGEEGSYAGWYIGGAVIVAVIAVGIGLWFAYHP